MSKKNICLYGLAKQFTDEIGKELSTKLDVYYANFEKIFEFEMIDLDRLQEVCGKEYLEKKETSLLKRLCSYDNTLINLDYSLLNSEINRGVLEDNCLIIYIKLNIDKYKVELKKDNVSKGNFSINLDLYKDRNQLCEEHADIIVECNNIDEHEHIVDSIIVEILKYFD